MEDKRGNGKVLVKGLCDIYTFFSYICLIFYVIDITFSFTVLPFERLSAKAFLSVLICQSHSHYVWHCFLFYFIAFFLLLVL